MGTKGSEDLEKTNNGLVPRFFIAIKMNKSKEICIGARIREVFDKKNMSITRFAELLHCDRANVYNIFRRKTMDICRLLEISEILNHNFVEEICAIYRFSEDTSSSKISFVLEINLMDSDTLKNLLETIKRLEIKMIREMKN